jgi:regulator of protease activity HflC (stomatin/prohibitin superfamily)
MGGFEWLSKAMEWFAKWIPALVILDTRSAGVKWVRGGKVKVCKPGGLYLYWPLVTTFDCYPVVRQADDLRTQTIVTSDDKTISIGGMVVYEISDIEALLTKVHSAERTINDITLTAIHDVCCQMTWEELKQEQRKGTLDTKLKNAAKRALEEYGVCVIKTMLTDLAPCRVLKVVQSVSNDSDSR